MKLTYRGVGYTDENSYLTTSLVEARKKEIIYRGNSPLGRINSPKFPYLGYLSNFSIDLELSSLEIRSLFGTTINGNFSKTVGISMR